MGATNVSHGVINIDVKELRPEKVAAFLQSEASLSAHPIATGVAPDPVVQHKTAAQLEAEAQSLEVAVEQLKADATNAEPSA